MTLALRRPTRPDGPLAVETRHAKLKCEGTCRNVTEHSYVFVKKGMDGAGGPTDYLMFECQVCLTPRVWGTLSGSGRASP